MSDTPKKKTGRPPKPDGALIQKSIRLTAEQWRSVEAAARYLDRSQSWVIAACIRASLGDAVSLNEPVLRIVENKEEV